MKKRVWVLNYKTEDLQSVENISSALTRLYAELPHAQYEVSIIELVDAERVPGAEWRAWTQEFIERPPEHIAIVHPSVNHHIFFKSLLFLKSQTQFIFHVFGNFVRNGESWFGINHLLQEKNVQFAAASASYMQLLEKFMAKESLALLPFPVKKIDLPLAHKEDPSFIRVLYAGRYHEQKNVTLLIEKLSELSIHHSKKIRLTLAVSFDDFNPTTLNEPKKLGAQFRKYTEVLKNSGDKIEIAFIQHTNFEKLQTLYKENEIFVSFSTFLDEDYGCAVLESLCSGTPCIVTNWCGYKDFVRAFPEHCKGIEVRLEDGSFIVDLEGLSEQIKELSGLTLVERRELAEKAQDIYGSKQLQRLLEVLFSKKHGFSGFHEKLNGPMTIESFKVTYRSFWEN